MSDTLPASSAVAKPPPASASIHNKLLEKAVPPWLTGAAPASLQALKAASTVQPDWHRNATPSETGGLRAIPTNRCFTCCKTASGNWRA